MSLVKCPECGNEISPTAQLCVKCGCEITCCPECSKVFSGKKEICDCCGFEIKPTLPEDKTPYKTQTQKIQQQIEADTKTLKRFLIASRIIEIVTVLISALGAIMYFVWKNSNDPLMKLKQMKPLFDNLKAISILGMTLFLLSLSLMDFIAYFFEMRRNNWLQSQKFDYKTYIKKYNTFGIEGENAQNAFSLIKRSAFNIENPNEKYISLVLLILQIVLTVLIDICACVWIVSNLNNMYLVKLIDLNAEYNWTFASASFIMAIIFSASSIATTFLADIPQNNRFKKWCVQFESRS